MKIERDMEVVKAKSMSMNHPSSTKGASTFTFSGAASLAAADDHERSWVWPMQDQSDWHIMTRNFVTK